MERLTYAPSEIREAFRFANEQALGLVQSHIGNYRRVFTRFVEAMTQRQEAQKLLARLLDGHRDLDGKRWFKLASDGAPPALPKDRYGKLALVWKLVPLPVEKPGADFDVKSGVDLNYVMAHAFPGDSLGEKYEKFRVGYLEPFATELSAWGEAMCAKLPASGTVDLWDVALAAL
jgi:hypothetical protein